MVSTRTIPSERPAQRDGGHDSNTGVMAQLSTSTTSSVYVCAQEVDQQTVAQPRIGERVEVYWPADEAYYAGLVVGYNDNRCRVAYEDGDVENLDLNMEKWRYVQQGQRGTSSKGEIKCPKRARAEKVLYAAVARCDRGPAAVRVRAAADLLAAALADDRVLYKICATKYSRAALPGNLRGAVRAAFEDVRMQRYQNDVARALAVLLTARDQLRRKYRS